MCVLDESLSGCFCHASRGLGSQSAACHPVCRLILTKKPVRSRVLASVLLSCLQIFVTDGPWKWSRLCRFVSFACWVLSHRSTGASALPASCPASDSQRSCSCRSTRRILLARAATTNWLCRQSTRSRKAPSAPRQRYVGRPCLPLPQPCALSGLPLFPLP